MKDLADITVCVCDHKLFLPIARRLAEDVKHVYYWTPCETGFSTIREACPGDGFENITRVRDFWPIKKEIDLFVFLDIEHSGTQIELASQGFPVWGPREGDELELDREGFLEVLEGSGLDVPPHEKIQGITELRKYLEDKEDLYIKISRFRGDLETTHWRNWKLDRGLLAYWEAVKFGPLSDHVTFLVFENIKTPLEIGGDTYNVRGAWPGLMLHGIEWKDKGYFSAVTKREKMPEQIRAVLEAFGPHLAQSQSATQFSLEIRVRGEQFFFTDPTVRGGLPSTASQLLLWKNFPEIIWQGAHGVLVEPEPAAKFSLEAILSVRGPRETWSTVELPEELEPWARLTGCCYVDGVYAFPPDDDAEGNVGWLAAIGDTPREALDNLKDLESLLPDGMSASVESIANIVQEIEIMEEREIHFTDKPMPEPGEVLEKA